MATANFKHLFNDLLKRAELYCMALGAQRRCALRLDRIADALLAMGARIDLLRDAMARGALGEPLDADRSLRESLRGLKQDIRGVRCQLASMQTPQPAARLQRAFARLATIAERTYAMADKLQWE
ncbi:MAG: hypothetical protein H7176_14250, partial [Bdellovibrionales bacterium]|nr:hypothetical protein [Massilia sp.]